MRFSRASTVALLLIARGALAAAPTVLGTDPNLDGQTTPGAYVAVNSILGSGVITVDYEINTGVGIFFTVGNTSATDICPYTGGGGGSCGTHVNHAPYFVAAAALETTGASLPFMDSDYYASLEAAGSAGAAGVVAAPNAGTNAAVIQLPAAVMTVSSPNSGDANHGTGGYGVDVFLSASYLGQTTNSDSADIGVLTGIFAAVGYAHSSFNAFDVHAVLRQTASNWTAGWNTTNGYGNVNYSTASGSISTIYLQPPDLQVANHGYYLTGTLYPFRQTRRSYEVVYSVSASYSWGSGCVFHGAPYSGSGPLTGCEMTAADITASGATLLYSSSGSSATTPTFSYTLPPPGGTVTLIAFTTDGSGNYSRPEVWSEESFTLVVGASCP